jgi:3-oxoacyl-[acyl-carrier-protein] synthase-3
MVFPSTAALLQNKLGIVGCPVFDVQAVCSGFVYAMTVADAMIKTGTAKRALVIGAEVFSRILDFKDRTTCVLFGDGAGAVVLEASSTPGILATDIHADGKYADILCVPGHVSGGAILGDPVLKMDGQAVFKLAVGVLEETARASLSKAGLNDTDIDWLIPHQANIRIMQSTAKTQNADGKSHCDCRPAWQYLGCINPIGTRSWHSLRPNPQRPDLDVRRRWRRLHVGLSPFKILKICN